MTVFSRCENAVSGPIHDCPFLRCRPPWVMHACDLIITKISGSYMHDLLSGGRRSSEREPAYVMRKPPGKRGERQACQRLCQLSVFASAERTLRIRSESLMTGAPFGKTGNFQGEEAPQKGMKRFQKKRLSIYKKEKPRRIKKKKDSKIFQESKKNFLCFSMCQSGLMRLSAGQNTCPQIIGGKKFHEKVLSSNGFHTDGCIARRLWIRHIRRHTCTRCNRSSCRYS